MANSKRTASGRMTPSPDEIREEIQAAANRWRSAAAEREKARNELSTVIRSATQAGISLAEIARLAGVTRQTVYSLERDAQLARLRQPLAPGR